ncbi:unnamed protein product, partial [Brassica oleracea var. botrytis]
GGASVDLVVSSFSFVNSSFFSAGVRRGLLSGLVSSLLLAVQTPLNSSAFVASLHSSAIDIGADVRRISSSTANDNQ